MHLFHQASAVRTRWSSGLAGAWLLSLSACAVPEPASPPAAPQVTVAALPVDLAADRQLAMLQLANRAGCTACHQVDHPEPDDEDDSAPSPRPPVGPFWRDVANRYRHDPLALQRLTAAVTNGSAPLRPHWRDVAGLAMPPNRALLTDAQAQQLLGWILALPEVPQDPPAAADPVKP